MNKRSRFVLLLAVLAICFVFLWPSICWYGRTPKEMKALALSSTENIKSYAEANAAEDVREIKMLAKEDPTAKLEGDFAWLEKDAAKNYKALGEKVPAEMTIQAVLGAYDNELEFMNVIQAKYRDEILKAKKYYDNSVKLGLDLSGGMNVIVRADLDAAVEAQGDSLSVDEIPYFKEEAMANVLENLTSRIDKFGLTSPIVRKQGEDRIYIEIPGAAQADAINTLIMGKGILNFRLADMDATAAFKEYYMRNPASTFNAIGQLMDPSIIPADTEVLGIYTKDAYGLDERVDWLVVKKDVVLDGKHIQSATVTRDEFNGQPQVAFNLDLEGAQIFAEFTGAHVGDYLAIVSDGKVKSNARIQSAITGGSGVITGNYTSESAQELALLLRSGALPAPLNILEERTVGAGLGADSIEAGINASIIGFIGVVIFLLVAYGLFGFFTTITVFFNLFLMLGALSLMGATLTLPGIAGIILTIGMAVDANVLIFERMREEVKGGRSIKDAIESGFTIAWGTIFDSNLTTLIAAGVLFYFGSGPVRGFAVTLAVGIVTSLFTSVSVTRLFITTWYNKYKPKALPI